MVDRLLRPQATLLRQAARFNDAVQHYQGKLCCLCGRAYLENGLLDSSWETTARFVKAELDAAGVYGVGDGDVKRIVASCREAVLQLFKHIASLQYKIHVMRNLSRDEYEMFNRLTFAGRLSTIIEFALEGRRIKLIGGEATLG
jgi:hypothetical protein